MAFVDWDSQYFYCQTSTKALMTGKKQLTVSNNMISMSRKEKKVVAAFMSWNELSVRLQENDVIEIFNISALSEKELFNAFHKSALGFKDIEAAVKGKINYLFFYEWWINTLGL